jgi:hypothetical protein
MTGEGIFAKSRLGDCPLQHALCRFHVHPLDHLILEPFRTALEGFNQFAGALDLLLGRREGAVARFDLVRVDETLAIEAHSPALSCLRKETFFILEPIEHAIEGCDP